ncbi:MAG TPA: hypothetical protein VEK08_16710 [Planctomycetota bacterium]|nr:hypothetical protein [Planctomycetota bacterium]
MADVALGVCEYVFSFAKEIGAATYREWKSVGLTKRDPISSEFELAFEDAIRTSENVHFCLDGIVDIRTAVKLGEELGPQRHNVTNWELYRVTTEARPTVTLLRN